MGLGRFIGRAIGGIVALGVTAAIVLPLALVGLPLILLAVAGVVGAALLFTVGVPVLIVGILVAVALGALVSVTVGLVGFGLFLLKVAFFAIILSWIFRKVIGATRKPEPALVGAPVADIAAPRRDKYDIEAEKELDRELGM
jgi:hypothetical protein